ncbi:hypothetical protein GCM10010191_56430 [Actinomadura vinacea]|uniref:J domain-containing protein n=1 Tax=Actinomadura vinacea TaxID=115336 RepID=A0ABP5WSQ2_9ACTN
MMTADERAVFRAWVRTHHPDVGGDPGEFAEGLRRMRASRQRASRPRAHPAPVVVGRHRRGPIGRLIRWRARRARARRLL